MPAVEGQLSHVGHVVALVHDFQSDDGLDDVLEGDDALEAAVFVDDAGDVAFVAEHGVPDFGHGHLLFVHDDVAFYLAQGHVELVFGKQLEGFAAEDVAGDVLVGVAVDGDAREVAVGFVAVELFEGHLLGGDGGHGGGGHDVLGFHVVEFDDVLYDFVLVFVNHFFVLGHIGHGGDFLTADGGFVLVLGYGLGEFLHHPHDGEEHDDDEPQGTGGEPHELFPVAGADGLGDDL